LQDCRREHFQKNAKGISEKAKGQEDQETSVNRFSLERIELIASPINSDDPGQEHWMI
jgi:hypothetical protein